MIHNHISRRLLLGGLVAVILTLPLEAAFYDFEQITIDNTAGGKTLIAAQNQGFSIQGTATGLAAGTAVWFDLQVADVTGGTASVSNVTCSAYEI